jgi:hypothetical protein
MDDTYPKPVSDPAAEGLPDYADDDSTAFDDVLSPRESDGRDPAPLPPDRDTGPLALDEFGTTAEEQRQGEPLDQRLAREEGDVQPDSVAVDPDPLLADEAVGEAAAGQVADDGALLADGPVDPHLGSPVSMYDRFEPGVPDLEPVGRLVQPDEGAHADAESTEIAVDEGAAGGGASAEELAIHRVPREEVE